MARFVREGLMPKNKLLITLGALALLSGSALAQPAAPANAPASIAALVGQVNLPHEEFTLPNGLRVIVHTDRKAPIVAVSVWYHIGSKDEPKGKTGFAHLFEHLMFYGSENNDGVFFKKLEDVGATDANGTTWFDRTNYYENVPTQALDLALFLESDRMGWLLGAVTQAKLDAQRGVVQNEKRQGDNEPFGLTGYSTLKALFPEGHPYHHDTIGSMTDLNGASLADVQGWFRANYGPNNAVLVLAGDIDAATARPLIERYFGAIPRGPEVKRITAPVPRWTAERRETLHDKVPTPRLSLHWPLPGRLDRASAMADVALTVLAGGSSSRLYNELVRTKKLAVAVSGGVQAFEKVSMAEIEVTLAPGVKPDDVEAVVKKALADFIANGPTADEVSRVAARRRRWPKVRCMPAIPISIALNWAGMPMPRPPMCRPPRGNGWARAPMYRPCCPESAQPPKKCRHRPRWRPAPRRAQVGLAARRAWRNPPWASRRCCNGRRSSGSRWPMA
jgi:zinc protease